MPADPTPHGPIPTPRQLAWHRLEAYGFIHFTINTFTDREWGFGDESPALFDPSGFDPDQIVGAAKDGGLKGIVLTCKHHDGFCLWPSRFTEHSVKASPWKKGKGDMVREVSQACRRHGLRFGVYLSPWDRNHADYGRPAYLTYYRNQLRELLTNYGRIFEVWFDGANGGDGYYGGARETRRIDNSTYYDWENTWKIVRELQPDACMFSDAGPDVRWVGNESGFAGDPCWATIKSDGLWPGHADSGYLNRGDRDGDRWIPAEVDVSIRPGWFWHEKENDRVKSPEQLRKIWFESVGRGANLILNLPPDRRGILHEKDVASLKGLRRHLDATFAHDAATGARVEASSVRGRRWDPKHVADGKPGTFWCAADDALTPEVTLTLPEARPVSVVRLREHLPLGQRIDSFAIDTWQGGDWRAWATGNHIGPQRLVAGERVHTDRVRVRITRAAACPALSEISLFVEPGTP